MKAILSILILIVFFGCSNEEVTLDIPETNAPVKTRTGGLMSDHRCPDCGTQFPSIDLVNVGKAPGFEEFYFSWGGIGFQFDLEIEDMYSGTKFYYSDFFDGIGWGIEFLNFPNAGTNVATYWATCLNCNNGNRVGVKGLMLGANHFTIWAGGLNGDCLNHYKDYNLGRANPYLSPYKLESLTMDGDHGAWWLYHKIDRIDITKSRYGFMTTYTLHIDEDTTFELPNEPNYRYQLKFYSSKSNCKNVHYITGEYTVYGNGPSNTPHQIHLTHVNNHSNRWSWLRHYH